MENISKLFIEKKNEIDTKNLSVHPKVFMKKKEI